MTTVFHGTNALPLTLPDILRWRAWHDPQGEAYTFLLDGETEQVQMTYADLDLQARRIAARLMDHAVPGERVLLFYSPGLEYVAALFGCFYAGVVAVPAYPPRLNQSLMRIQTIFQDAQATVALTTSTILSSLHRTFGSDPLMQDLQWIATDTIDLPVVTSYQDPHVDLETLALLQYTSGSTGSPKGVMLTHENLVQNAALIQEGTELSSETRALFWLPPYHDMGLMGGILQALYTGYPIVLMAPAAFLQQPLRWLQAISSFRATLSGGPNFAYDLCVRKATQETIKSLDLSSWAVAFNGAEPVRAETLQRFAETFAPSGFRPEAFYPCYGMAETTLFISGGRKDEKPGIRAFDGEAIENGCVVGTIGGHESSRLLVSCGSVRQRQEIAIVDPQTSTRCPPSTIGEIWVRGPNVALGYWGRIEETVETFQAFLQGGEEGPFLRTGDLGFCVDNELFVTGRLKDLIIIRGRNLYPQDIEQVVEKSHPLLRQGCCAIFAVEGAISEQVVVVQEVVRHYNDPGVQEAIQAIYQAVLSEFDVEVAAIELLRAGTIPKTTSGKIQRRVCRQQFLSGELKTVYRWNRAQEGHHLLAEHLRREAALEEADKHKALSLRMQDVVDWLVMHIAERAHMDARAVDLHAPFVQFGLNSLEAIGLSGELEQWLGRSLSPTLIYDYPSIEALARHLVGADLAVETNPGVEKRHAGQTDAIAIIGLGCRFPGANNLEAFWQMLHDGIDAISLVPETRWDTTQFYAPDQATQGKMNTRWGGFLRDIELFDPSFFHISPREARHIDPQQRLLLEVAWETLENAGQAPDKLAGSQTGVFIGISSDDYAHLHLKNAQLGDAYAGTGNAHSIAANRLSYMFNLCGPSMAIDTACSSSLVAVHQACQSLRSGECDLALAGGVNVLLSPELTVTFSQARMMSSDGRCKTFDAAADGYVRGEGCGLVLLKPLAAAERDGDTVLAIVRGSAVNQDGRSNGLTAPNGPSQEAVIRRALQHAKVSPNEISYVETHGSSTPLGDPIEVDALKAVFMQHRSPDQPCLLGAVKTNIGHLEAAAGIAGLIKTVLCLQKGMIVPNLHFTTLNQHISFDGTTFEIPTEPRQWPGQPHVQRLAGVSAFGFGGTNVHVILEGPSQVGIAETDRAGLCPERGSDSGRGSRQQILSERSQHLLTISGRTAQALSMLAQRYCDFLVANPTVSISDLCHTAQTGRAHFAHRLAISASNTEQLREQLSVFVAGQPREEIQVGKREPGQRQIAFLFPGQGCQHVNMARQLYETQPTFRATLDECDRLLRPLLPQPVGQESDYSLLSLLYPVSSELSPINETAYTQPALFALEYALAQMWLSWGIKPDVVMGHSVGEYVAACIAGVFSLEDGLKLITARGRLMQALPERGTMAMIWAEPSWVLSFLDSYVARGITPQVSLAALNGPNHTVISGRAEQIQLLLQELAAFGIRTHVIPVSHAFHSPLLDPMLDAFEQVAREVAFAPLRLPLVCNLTGQLINAGETLDAHYWRRQTREAVQFATGIQTLVAHGYELFLELGPTPVLSNLGKRCLPANAATWLPSLRQDHEDWHILMQSIASLYCKGCNLNWSNFDGNLPYQKIALPTYPFEREHCWLKSEETNEGDTGRDRVSWANKADGRDSHVAPEEPKGKPLIDFGLIFFSSSEASVNEEIYRLVTESARYADQHDFSSIWIPERHFTKEGWLYPNPAILTSALARETSRIHLRAGSVVVPLHHPLRIAEDWAMVDHLSGGRVGISFASGWHPDDFSLAPENYADRSAVMYRNIEIVRKLWRGETVPFKGGDGKLVELKTYPFPMQHDIPVWLTAAGNPQTFANAGKLGFNLLTHMYNQSVDELAEKIRIYRNARAEHGYDPATGKVSVMLHTYIGADMDTVHAQIQGPFSHYLKSASSLLNAIAYSRGQQINLAMLTEQDLQDYVIFVTDRLIREQRVLFGTPQTCAPLVTQLQAAGVDEIACQMDFGVDTDLVLKSLPYLNQLREQSNGTVGTRLAPISGNVKASVRVEYTGELTSPTATVPTRGSHGTQNEINTWLYQLRWQALDLSSVPAPTSPGHWLIFIDQKGIGQHLARQLQEQGYSCSLVEAGQTFQTIGQHHYRVNPANPQEIRQAVGTALAAVRAFPLRGVIHLWSLDATPVAATNSTRLLADQMLGVQSALSLMQALISESLQTRLWLITQGAQPVGGGEATLAVAQAPIWGLGKTCTTEHPEIWGGLIDLDPRATDLTISQLITILVGETLHENQIALRGTKIYVARMVHVEAGVLPESHTFHISPDVSYLITGGLWGLGLEVARWLATRGARHLILLGRSKLPPRETWDQVPLTSRQGIQIAGIRVIEQLGAKVHAASVDVTDEAQLAAFLHLWNRGAVGTGLASVRDSVDPRLLRLSEEKPPIRGIIHAASVWQDTQGQSLMRPIVDLKAEDLVAVLRPKMLGGWLLSNLLKETPLDFFVSFSSAATLFGSATQGNYAVANEFLDVLAYYQRAQGQPAISIDWAPISETGFGAIPEGLRFQEYWASRGIERLSPQQVLAVLELLLQEDLTRVGVLKVDWQMLRQSYPQMVDLPLISHLVSSRKETGDATHGGTHDGPDTNNGTNVLQTLQVSHLVSSRKETGDAAYGGTHDEPDTNNGTNVLQTLQNGYEEGHSAILTSYVKAQISTVLGVPAQRLETEEPLIALGFDSLMAIKLKNRMDLDLQIHLPIVTLLQGPSITQLVKQVLALVPSRVETVVTQAETRTEAVGTGPRSGPVPTELLSYNQKGLWFLFRLAPESAAYNLLCAVRIQQHLDAAALQRALRRLLDRYPILTSTYNTLQNGEPVQQTGTCQPLSLEEIDATSTSLADLKRLLEEESNQPIDLTKGPILRLKLYRRADDDYVLSLIVHHIVADSWALELLIDELSLLYSAEKTDLTEPLRQQSHEGLAEPDFQHTDYVYWQQSMLQSEEGEQHWQYWQTELAGDLPVLNLPTDRPRPPLQTYKGASQSFSFNIDLVKRLQGIAHGEKVTLFTLMLAAYQVLLHRYSNQDDILVGTPTLGRTRSEFERVIGFLTNLVVVRARVGQNPTFKELLQQTKRSLLVTLEHQDFPFALLAERLKLRRDLSTSPIFQTVFTWDRTRARNGGERTKHEQALSVEPFAYGQQGVSFDLILTIFEIDDRLSAEFRYNVDLFDAGTIARMAEHFLTLLDGITNNLDQHIREMPLLPDNVRQTLLTEWNATTSSYPQEMTVHQLFEQRVGQTPDAIAVVFEESSLTYHELNSHANQLAHRLRGYQVDPDVLVGVCMERSLELVVALLAVLKAGGAYVPLDPSHPQERLLFMLEDAQISVVLTQTPVEQSLRLRASQIHFMCVGTDRQDFSGQADRHAREAHQIKRPISENLAYVIYTSGSTGRPKGVGVSHRSLVNLLSWFLSAFQITAQDRALIVTSPSFDLTQKDMLALLLVGGTVHLQPPGYDVSLIRQSLTEREITLLNCTPSMFYPLVDDHQDDAFEFLTSLRCVFLGGEPIALSRLRRWMCAQQCHAEMVNTYGPTECTDVVAFSRIELPDQWEEAVVPIGRPIANTQIYLLDRSLQPVPIGVAGELYIGGMPLARGYVNQPDLTAEGFLPHPFVGTGSAQGTIPMVPVHPGERLYRTGDLARYRADGAIEYLGRIDSQVKLRGYRIELGEIEAALVAHPALQDGVVVVREDVPGEMHLVAYLVAHQGQTLSQSDLRTYLQARLPSYMIPSMFMALDALPLTPSGKVDRKALPLPDSSQLGACTEMVAPQTPLQEQLALIWAELLHLPQVGIRHNFFELGGHSLLAVELLNRINRQFGSPELSLATLLQEPTIEQIAALLQKPVKPEASRTQAIKISPCIPIQPAGEKPPFFCVHPVSGDVSCFLDLARHLRYDRPFYGIQSPGRSVDQPLFSTIEEMATAYIDALLAVQPEGPYFLGGYSFGGLVAFEMARQLQARGGSVALLALLDSYPRDPRASAYTEVTRDDTQLLLRMAERSGRYRRTQIAVSYEDLSPLQPDEQLAYLLDRLREAQIVPNDMDISQFRRYIQVEKAHRSCSQRYRPQFYSGRITLLRSEERGGVDPSLWSPFSSEPVEVHPVSGDHFLMVVEPYVRSLAVQLQQCLDKADGV